MIINEVLNYAVLNVKRMDKESLMTVLAKFYHEDELFTAKSLLCKHVSELQSTVDATLEDRPPYLGGRSWLMVKVHQLLASQEILLIVDVQKLKI